MRGLKTLDVILTNYQDEDLNTFLDSIKERLIQKLYYFLSNSQDNNIMISVASINVVAKLLGKLGHVPRTYKIKQNISQTKVYDFQYLVSMVKSSDNFIMHVNLLEPINMAIQIIEQVSEEHRGTTAPQIKYSTLEIACTFLQSVLFKLLQKKIDIEDIKIQTANSILNDNLQIICKLDWNINQPSFTFKRSYELVGDIIKTLLNFTRYRKFKGKSLKI